MSWLLGSRFNQQQQPQNFSQLINPPPASGGGGDDDGPKDGKNQRSSMEYRFDSSALERAAAAAKELEKSAHAKESLELLQKQEATKQMELQSEMKKIEANIEQMKSERNRLDAEERRRMMQEETKQHQARAQYQDQLARKRYDDQLAQQHRMNEENLRRQEESVAKQEAMRKATIEHQIAMENKNFENRLEMEMRAKAKLKRENFDLTLEKLKLKAQENRETTLESIKLYGLGASSFLESPPKIAAAVAGLSLLAVGIYAAKGGMGIMARQLEARLSKPTLVRETSRISALDVIKHPIQSVQKLIELRKLSKSGDALKGIVLSSEIEAMMRDVAIATKNTKRNKGVFPNLLMYGPPGTGKTMFSRKLAQHSGLDYAIVSGGDFAPLGKDGVTEIHKIFDWASTSRKGLLLFIDEAESFLRHRNQPGSSTNSESISMDQRMMLSAFLEKTGTPNRKFMLVLASNEPQDFDAALMDRIDMNINFALPGFEERKRMIYDYFIKYVLEPATRGNKRFKVDQFSIEYTEFCSKVAEMTEGFSGRQLEKLVLAWQRAIFASENGVLTEQMAMKECLRAISEHQKKMQMMQQAVTSAKKSSTNQPDVLFGKTMLAINDSKRTKLDPESVQ